VGVPGTARGWQAALDQYGATPLADLLEPAMAVAETGFVVDEAFAADTEENFERFRSFSSTAELFLPGGQVPAVGSLLRNPDLADTFELLSEQGVDAFYEGELAEAIVDAVQDPPVTADTTLNVRPGLLELDDLADYAVVERDPTTVSYRGYQVYGMGPPSSGGSTVGEALNILEGFDLAALSPAERLHRYLEASRLAYADRNSYLGDPAFVDVPLSGLLADAFAAERRAQIGPSVPTGPVPPGDPRPYEGEPGRAPAAARRTAPAAARGDGREGLSTTHITTSDADGNVVAYTCTIEQFGGSGIVVDGYGFLLNNELTDFEPEEGLANSPEAGKRPRSSMSPTIVLREGEPVLALGSPGGATIITTVLQTLLNHLDAGMALPEAIAAPRVSQRNAATAEAEPAFLATAEAAALSAVGHQFSETTSLGGSIGAATGIAFLADGRVQAAAEPSRRGGGSAMVEQPDSP
jgi:gamma-glutamyltranspeptidase/glutathione hydrolase